MRWGCQNRISLVLLKAKECNKTSLRDLFSVYSGNSQDCSQFLANVQSRFPEQQHLLDYVILLWLSLLWIFLEPDKSWQNHEVNVRNFPPYVFVQMLNWYPFIIFIVNMESYLNAQSKLWRNLFLQIVSNHSINLLHISSQLLFKQQSRVLGIHLAYGTRCIITQ